MKETKSIVWFRQDLRLKENPALEFAVSLGKVLPVYILDQENTGDWRPGKASRWWLHHSLASLDNALNGSLCTFNGDPFKILTELIADENINNVFWNRCYEPWQVARDKTIKCEIKKLGLNVKSFNGSLLHEPWEVSKSDGTPYKVFTPYYRQTLSKGTPKKLHSDYLTNLNLVSNSKLSGKLDSLNLLSEDKWSKEMILNWTPGEDGAENSLVTFLTRGLPQYKRGRDYPSMEAVSRLSPHLHFGEVSPNHLWHAVTEFASHNKLDTQAEHYQRELAWREFSYSLLHYFPDLDVKNLNNRFDEFPWNKNTELIKKWCAGQTGYPLIDAGMRELSNTGYMHNRVRMITASFLVKNLLVDWRSGAQYFWDALVDADLANNSCSWQWVAGSGADAAPYFRIFNPVTQSKKFDPDAKYIKQWIPELTDCPNKYIHDPSSAPSSELQYFGIRIGKTYPSAIVDLKASREAALNAYHSLKKIS